MNMLEMHLTLSSAATINDIDDDDDPNQEKF